jgi:hypothetical protein
MWKTICWFPAQNTSIAQSIKVFAIDRCFFGNNSNNYNIIKWPIFELSYKLETKWPIFVYEGAVELGLIEYNYYIDAVKEQIERYSQEKNYIKFHPMQSNKERKHIENLFIEENKEVVVLPMDIPFELFITSNKDLNIYGFGSSLLFFSKTYGHNVISDEKNLLISNKYKWYYSKVSLKK